MFRHLMPILTICLCCLSGIAQDKTITLSKSKCGNNLQIKQNSNKRFSANVNFDAIRIENKSSKNGDFCELTIDGTYKTGDEGEPELPALRKLVQVPHGCQFKVRTRCADTAVYNLSDYGIEKQIFPHQRSYTKDVDPNSQKIKKNRKAYKRNTFNTQNLIQVERIGTLRGIDLCQITVNPVRYNPAQNTIQVFNDIDIDIDFTKATSAKSASNTASPYFEPIFNSIANYKSTSSDLTKYPVKYLIVTHPDFVDALSDFIFWKTQKGFDVVVATTDTIGSSASEIKKWIAAQYASSSPAPSFLLLCADTDKIPCAKTGASSKYGTDLYYACMDGDDDIIPDMYYGRFSARTAEQMKAIADKTVTYEKYQFEDPSFLSKATMIAGYDGTYRSNVGIPTLNYVTSNRINASNGYSAVHKFTNQYANCYADTCIAVGLMTYTAHGSTTTWEDPELTKTKVKGFTNSGKTPFVIANCCLSGQITTDECLGEAWVRKENSGAVAYIGSSPKTYWHEDFYWAVGAHEYKAGKYPTVEGSSMGAFDAPFVSDFVCGGAILFAGNMAVTEAIDNNYPCNVKSQYYWEGYNYLGDPSLLVYFGEGADNPITHETAHPISAPSINISASSKTYVAISQNGKLIDAGFVLDGENNITLNIPQDINTGIIDIIATKARYKPYIGTLNLITPDQPFVTLNSAWFNNGKNIKNGDVLNLNLALLNVGLQTTNNAMASISCKSNLVKSLTLNKTHVNNIKYMECDTINDICCIELSNDIPDQTKIDLKIAISNNEYTFNIPYSFRVNAPKIQLCDTVSIEAENDFIMPGDTASIGIKITNIGHADLETASINIIPDENQPFASIVSNTTLTLNDLKVGCTDIFHFSLNTDINTDIMTDFHFTVIVSSETPQISDTMHYCLTIGKLSEIALGNGKTKLTYLFNNYYRCGKSQLIYTASELGDSPKRIDEISFDIAYTISPNDFPGYKNILIKIKETDKNSISEYFNMDDAQIVYSRDKFDIMGTGPVTFVFDSAFVYNGKNNIVLELTWGVNDGYVSKSNRTQVFCSETSTNTIGYDFEDVINELYFYNANNYRPNTTFRYKNPQWAIFNLVDNNTGEPITNASISIGGKTFRSNTNGKYEIMYFDNIYNKPYHVNSLGYKDINGIFTPQGDTTTLNLNLTLAERHTITFHTTDSSTGTNIANASITIGGKTIYTNNTGLALMDSIPESETLCLIEKDGYFSYSKTILCTSDSTLAIALTAYPTISIRTMANDAGVNNAVIHIDSQCDTTDANGYACFRIPTGTHNVLIMHSDYAEIRCPINSLRANIDTTFSLTELPDVCFMIYCDNKPLANATITVDNDSCLTDGSGTAIFSHVRNGQTHEYSISGNMISNQHGSFCNSLNDTTISLSLESSRATVIFCITDNNVPQAGMNVCVYGQTIKTNADGIASFSKLVFVKRLPYSIGNGYSFCLYDTTAVDKDTVKINIDLAKISFEASFFISVNALPLESASVTLNDSTKLTDANGFATFGGLKAGDLMNYTIRKDGYTTTDGKTEASWSTICGGDTKIEIELVPADTTSVTLQSANISIYPNPSNGLLHTSQTLDNCLVSVFDLNGKLIKSFTTSGNNIDLRPIRSGSYTLTIKSAKGTTSLLIDIQ